jgi:hypothetical protein
MVSGMEKIWRRSTYSGNDLRRGESRKPRVKLDAKEKE